MNNCECPLEEISTDKQRESYSASPWIMSHFIAVGLAIFLAWMSKPGSSLFSWHPFFMTIAFIILMFEAIMVFSKVSSLQPLALRQHKVQTHWKLQLFAILFAGLGFLAIFFNKIMHNKEHFTSLHSIAGLITLVLVLVQASQGITILYPKLPIARAFKLVQLKQIHALMGSITFIFACFTMVGGFNSNWFKQNAESGRLLCIIATLALGGVVVKQVSDAYGIGKKSNQSK